MAKKKNNNSTPNANQKIKCDVTTCIHNNCDHHCCDLKEIKVSSMGSNVENANCKDETVCDSFEE